MIHKYSEKYLIIDQQDKYCCIDLDKKVYYFSDDLLSNQVLTFTYFNDAKDLKNELQKGNPEYKLKILVYKKIIEEVKEN